MSAEQSFHALVSELDYPMFIVVAASGDRRAGCLVGFVTQASISPPRFMVMLSKLNRTCHVAQDSDELVVHFLSDADIGLAALFGQQTSDELDKFAHCTWTVGPGGTPVLAGTRGWITGRILERIDAGDHVAHLIDIRDSHLDAPGSQMGFQMVREMEPGHPA